MKNNVVRQITLSALILALTIICTRVLSIQNIPIVPFVRISIGPALIIFASIFLGPVSGIIVGAASDILGIVLFPNALGYSINPLFTVVYGLLGLCPFFIFKGAKMLKKNSINFCIISAILGSLCIFTTIFMLLNNSIVLFGKTYEFLAWHKALIISLSWVLSIASVLVIYFIDKHLKKKYGEDIADVYPIAVACILSELFVMLILNSIVKVMFFEVDFLFVFFSQAVVFFIDLPLNTFVVSLLGVLYKKVVLK